MTLDLQLRGKRALVTGSSSGIGECDDIAYAVLVLASPRSEFMNGSNLHVDGGIAPSLH